MSGKNYSIMFSLVLVVSLLALPVRALAASIGIHEAWARPSVTSTGAAYADIHNVGGEDDTLLGGSTDAAASLEIHEMKMDGVIMRMRKAERIAIPAGETVKLAPGGLHLMLIGLKAPLEAGKTLSLRLQFEKAGEVELILPIRAAAPAASPSPDHQDHDHKDDHDHKNGH